MSKIIKIFQSAFCKYCGRHMGSVGAGSSMNGMCERCYENGGDEE